MTSKKVPGGFKQRSGRWWWKVRLPGDSEQSQIPLVPPGSTLATKDWHAAEELACDIYQRYVKKQNSESDFDGTIAELCQRFMKHAREYYIDPHTNEPSVEVVNLSYAVAFLTAECPLLQVEDFGPLRLKALREKLVNTITVSTVDGKKETRVLGPREEFDPSVMRRKYSRSYINQRLSQIKRLFGWGAENELVPGSVHHALLAMKILRLGRTVAREGRKVGPVSIDVVKLTMQYAPPVVQAMIALQLLTGMRPGEVRILRAMDLDQSDPRCWIFRPYRSKNERFGIVRTIPIAPEAQALIKPYLTPNLDAFIFSPKIAKKERYAAMRIEAKHPRFPYLDKRRVENPKKIVRDCYTTGMYYQAVHYAIAKGRQAGAAIPSWHPNQIRHTVATLVEQNQGADAARALLGHTTLRTTQVYIKEDMAKAAEAALKMGNGQKVG